MRVNAPVESIAREGSRIFAASAHAIEKSSASSALDMRNGERDHGKEKTPPRVRVEFVCQSDTQAFDPFWDGPRLLPVFVAQLLGQVMPERRDARAMAHAVYGGAAPKEGLLLDRES